MTISGLVIKGLGIGKKLGFPPTMNLRMPSRSNDASASCRLHRRLPSLMPSQGWATLSLRYGIYAVFVKTPVGEFPGVLHYGPRPAVHAPLSFEVHCFGLKKKMYGKRVDVKIVKRLRGVKNFAIMGELKRAIKEDIKKAKQVFNINAKGKMQKAKLQFKIKNFYF